MGIAPFASIHIKGKCYQHDLLVAMLTFDHIALLIGRFVFSPLFICLFIYSFNHSFIHLHQYGLVGTLFYNPNHLSLSVWTRACFCFYVSVLAWIHGYFCLQFTF